MLLLLKTKNYCIWARFFSALYSSFYLFLFYEKFSDTKATHFIFNTHTILTTASPPLLIAFRNLSRGTYLIWLNHLFDYFYDYF